MITDLQPQPANPDKLPVVGHPAPSLFTEAYITLTCNARYWQSQHVRTIDLRHWLHLFLQACADHCGQTQTDLSSFLPWQMSEARRQQLALPLPTLIQAVTTEPECIDSS